MKIIVNEEKINKNNEQLKNLYKERNEIHLYSLSYLEKLKNKAKMGLLIFTISAASSLGAAILLFTVQSIILGTLLGVSVAGMFLGSAVGLVNDNKISKNREKLERLKDINEEIIQINDVNDYLKEENKNLMNNKINNMSQIPTQSESTLETSEELKSIQEEKSKYTKNPLRSGKR